MGREDRFRQLHGREMTSIERKFFHLREGKGYNGWFNWQSGKAESQAEVQEALEKRWAENEAAGLTYTREHGWVQKEQER